MGFVSLSRWAQSEISASILFVLISPVAAQVAWDAWPDFRLRADAAMAFDGTQNRMVIFGGTVAGVATDETWEQGAVGSWARVPVTTSPPPTSNHLMVWFPTIGIIMFGGNQAGMPSNQTWVFSGNNWSQLQLPSSPPARSYGSMAYDPVRQVIVLFGGASSTALLQDTWEFDGANWTARTPSHLPPAQARHRMAFEPNSSRVVLVGRYGDAWEWDGLDWRRIAAAPSGPGILSGFSLTRAPGHSGVLYFAGQATPWTVNSAAVWDGSAWQSLTQVAGWPQPRAYHTAAYDEVRDRVVVHGGSGDGFGNVPVYNDTWEWDGTVWSERLEGAVPALRADTRLAYDSWRGEIVLYGGHVAPDSLWPLGDTWTLSGKVWRQRLSTGATPMVGRHGFTFDSWRGRLVMFGGCLQATGSGSGWCYSYLGGAAPRTWEWDGMQWTGITTAVTPQHRHSMGMTFDSDRGRVVMFGGISQIIGVSGTVLGDTWEWDGSTWTQANPSASPSPRYGSAFAYDPGQHASVLFGDRSTLTDTWTWDGTSWVQLFPATSPSRAGSMAYDLARSRLVMVGATETWEMVNGDWVLRHPVTSGGGGPATYDASLGRIVSFAGTTWEYGPVYPASVEVRGAGCAGSNGTPVLLPNNPPWAGERAAFELRSVPPLVAAVCCLGFDDQVWNGIPLPMTLTSIGMPGCQLHVSPDLSQFIYGSTWTFPVPTDPLLLGGRFFAQALVFDPFAGNPARMTVSNSVAAVIGSK